MLAVTLPERRDRAARRCEIRRLSMARPRSPSAILLKNHNLHVEMVINPASPIGKDDAAGVADIILESAISTIMDCEDSVAAVDAEDKVEVYRNWLGLMKGTLEAPVEKKPARSLPASCNPDRTLHRAGWRERDAARPLADAGAQCRPSHADRRDPRRRGQEIAGDDARCGDHLADRHARSAKSRDRNSRKGSVYIVKPKLHGPEEVALRQRTVRRGGKAAGAAREHAEDGHHGRGAPHQRQPQGLHPGGQVRAWCSSTPASSTAPATRSIPRSRPARSSARRTSRTRRGSRPMRTATSISAWLAGCRARRRSARACGRRPTRWRRCWNRRSPIRRPAPIPPGCPRPPPRRCTPCTTMPSTSPRARTS